MAWTRYVAIGDSLTEGLADPRGDGTFRGWADRFAQHLADAQGAPLEYANFAIRGRLLQPIIDEQLEPALALQPDLVSIWGGGNDALRPNANMAKLVGALEGAIARIRATGAEVLVGTSYDPRGAPVLELTAKRCMEFNLAIWAAARRQGAHVVDVWHLTALRDWRMWDADRIHLNGEGHERVAQLALTTVGLEATMPGWDVPLPPLEKPTRLRRAQEDYLWTRDHLAPWIGRRIRRTSSGAGRSAKFPEPIRVEPTASVADTSADLAQ